MNYTGHAWAWCFFVTHENPSVSVASSSVEREEKVDEVRQEYCLDGDEEKRKRCSIPAMHEDPTKDAGSPIAPLRSKEQREEEEAHNQCSGWDSHPSGDDDTLCKILIERHRWLIITRREMEATKPRAPMAIFMLILVLYPYLNNPDANSTRTGNHLALLRFGPFA